MQIIGNVPPHSFLEHFSVYGSNTRKKTKGKVIGEMDDTIDCRCLETMKNCLQFYLEHAKKPFSLSKDLLSFVFKRIDDTLFSVPISHQAGRVFGYLSAHQFVECLDMYLVRFNAFKKETDIRAFVPFQNKMQYLHFGVGNEEIALQTLKYIELVKEKLPTIKKATSVLYPEIMRTLKHLYANILNPNDPIRKKEWQMYASKTGETKFWQLFSDIYGIASKLAPTTKYHIGCVDLMQSLLSHAPEDFYFCKKPSHTDEVFGNLKIGFKDKKERMMYLEFLKEFITNFNPDFIKKDFERVNAFVSACLKEVLQKKMVYTQEESEQIENFMFLWSKRNLDSAIHSLEDVLNPAGTGFTNECKIIAFHSLGNIANAFPVQITQYSYLIGPFITNCILENKKLDIGVVRAVLTCLPRIKNQSEEKMKEVKAHLGYLAVHSNSNLSTEASLALNRFVTLDTSASFLHILNILSNLLLPFENIYNNLDVVFSILKNIKKSLEGFVLSKAEIDPHIYLSTRKHLESVLLIWLCHTDARIRSEIYKILTFLKTPRLLEVTAGKVKEAPHIIDTLKKPVSNTFTDHWLPEVGEFISHHFDQEWIEFSWVQVEQRIKGLIENLTKAPESLDFVGNLLTFLFAAFQTEKFETSWKFLDLIIQSFGKQAHPKLFEKIVFAVNHMNPLGVAAIFKKVKEFPIKRNKKKEIVDPILEKNLFHILSILTMNIPDQPSMFDKAHIKDFVELLLLRWIGMKPDVEQLCTVVTPETWKYACNIMSKYITLLNQAKHPEQVVTVFSQHSVTHFQKALFEFVALENPLASVDVSGVQLMQSICSLGEILDENFVNQIFRYFHQIMRSNIQYQEEMVDAIGELLKKSPRLIKRVILYCHQEPLVRVANEEDVEDKKGEKKHSDTMNQFIQAIPKANTCYIEGICVALESRLEAILKETTLGHLALISLLNMHSSVKGVRNGAQKMMMILSRNPNTSLQMGTLLNIYTSDEEMVYHATSKRFCSYFVKMAPQLTQDIFLEANAAIIPLAYTVWKDMLTVLIPWANNFGMFVNDTKLRNLDSLFNHIFSISTLLYGRFPELVEELWISLINSSSVSLEVCNIIVHHLLMEYKKNIINPMERNLILNLYVFICRSEYAETVIQILLKQLRSFRFTIEGDVLKWGVTLGSTNDSSYKLEEQHVMQILVNLTYEFDLVFLPHLPDIFLNSVVLFNSVQIAPATEAKEILTNLYQNLAIRHSNKNQFDINVKFLSQFPKGKLSRDKEWLNKYLGGFTQHSSTLIQDVANLALDWCIKCPDKKISLESLCVFWNLNSEFDYELLETLSVVYFTSVQTGDDEKTILLLQIIKSIPSHALKQSKSLTLVVYLCFWSFASANKKIFLLALEICQKVSSIVPNDCLPEKIYAMVQDAWYSKDMDAEVTLSAALWKGLTSLETIDLTLELFDSLMVKFPNSMLLTANLIIGSILYTSGELKGDKLAALGAEDEYFASLIEMNEPLKPIELNLFMGDFVSIFKKSYKGHGNILCTMLLQLLQNGKSIWQTPCVLLLSELLPICWDETWTKTENAAFIHALKECMHDQDELFHKSAEKGMEFLMTALKCHYDLFNFVNKGILGYETSVKGVSWENRDIFIGINATEQEKSRKEILTRIWTILFKKENNEEFVELIEKISKDLPLQERKRTQTILNMSEIRKPMIEKEFKQVIVEDETPRDSESGAPLKSSQSFMSETKLDTLGTVKQSRRISFVGVTKVQDLPDFKDVKDLQESSKNPPTIAPIKFETLSQKEENTKKETLAMLSPRGNPTTPVVPKINFNPAPLEKIGSSGGGSSKKLRIKSPSNTSSDDDEDGPVLKITKSSRMSARLGEGNKDK